MSAGQFIVCNSSDCKICLVKIFFFFFIKQCFSQGSLKKDSKYLCSTRRNSSQLLRSNSREALARVPGEAAFCPGKGCAGTGHCCSCSAEAVRSRALCSQYSVAKKGMGHFWICPSWLAKVASAHQPHRPFTWSLEGPCSSLEGPGLDPGLPSAFFFLS